MAHSEINVTPLIDVLLVLLIIFMVINPARFQGLAAQIPQPRSTNDSELREGAMVIQIDALGAIQINRTKIPAGSLGSRLEEIFKTRANRIVFVQGDPGLEFRSVAQVIDVVQGAGAEKIGLLSKH